MDMILIPYWSTWLLNVQWCEHFQIPLSITFMF